MRLIVARCEARYTGRLDTFLPEALRLVMIKDDGSVMIHADTGGYKPQNWMTPPTKIEEEEGLIVVTKHAGATEDRVEIRISEVISDVEHDMGEAAALERDGVEAHAADEPAGEVNEARAMLDAGPADRRELSTGREDGTGVGSLPGGDFRLHLDGLSDVDRYPEVRSAF